MLYKICYIFIKFLIYAVVGWICEMFYTSIPSKKVVNRGFLLGPYCPIYGCGCMLIIWLLEKFTDSPLVLFTQAMVICMALEYLTSLLMEVIFKARWWDYSSQKYNINGRVCLETAIPFGLGGLVIMYLINPIVDSILTSIPNILLIIISLVLFIMFITDFVVSTSVIYKFKNSSKNIMKDSTEEITEKVREYLTNHSVYTKRLVDAFPNVRIHEYNKKIIDKHKN